MKKASRTTGTAASMTTSTRMERDTMGELPVPSNAYYGVQTARAIENFPISSLRIPRAMIRAMGLIKRAAAARRRSGPAGQHPDRSDQDANRARSLARRHGGRDARG